MEMLLYTSHLRHFKQLNWFPLTRYPNFPVNIIGCSTECWLVGPLTYSHVYDTQISDY